ncbi:MAG: phosphopyruvate hydratase [Candidatus Nanogingivalaceae bacterium]|nr:phosphopyruvate hydratase [Candidatus Nanogingivalaceae bacterium]
MNDLTIQSIKARQIIDSRGNPTVEADVVLSGDILGRAAVPSGASTGSAEALELRDGGNDWSGKAVRTAVKNVNEIIAPALVGHDASDQAAIDQTMQELDGTDNKSKLGANAILSVSLAATKAAAKAKRQPLWRYIADMTNSTPALPLPMMNVLNGGAHAAFATDIQEFMIICKGAKTFEDTLKMGTEIFHALAKVLKAHDYPTTVGDEGGYAPHVREGNRESFALLSEAIINAGYNLGTDVAFAMDAASSEFYRDGRYELKCEGKSLSSSEMVDWLVALVDEFPIVSIEDGLAENDWDGWKLLHERLGDRVQLVGDDLLVTNTSLIRRAIDEESANALLVKPNQIGSLTETIEAVKMAQSSGWRTVMSHRSGETEDTTISHLAVGLGCGQIKTGSLSRTDRIAKYNELLRIAEGDESLVLARPFGE